MEEKNKTKFVVPALFDIRPVDEKGNFDSERNRIKPILNLKKEIEKTKKIYTELTDQEFKEILTKEKILAELEEIDKSDMELKKASVVLKEEERKIEGKNEEKKDIWDYPEDEFQNNFDEFESSQPDLSAIEELYFPEAASEKKFTLNKEEFKREKFSFRKIPKPLLSFILIVFAISLIIPGISFITQGMNIKDDVLSSSMAAYQNLLTAQNSLESADWKTAEENFNLAYYNFTSAGDEVKKIGGLALGLLSSLPGNSLISSGNHLIKVGENIAQAGQTLASAANLFAFSNLFDLISLEETKDSILASKRTDTLTSNLSSSQNNLKKALQNIILAEKELDDVEVASLPDDMQEGVSSLKEKMPLVKEMLDQALSYSNALLEILGHDNPRQYLLIFQNNSEIRATGGFIGTYGLLTLDQGVINDLFIDGIYNADGQLHEKIIPPRPIQKISTTWSMHDANWFADFPTSAEKIEWFYEKTGGPTVDGVISITPILIEDLLEITGPIAMPDYNIVLTKDNFIELIQYKVEIDYDKELNRPKKILADFAPKFIESLSSLSSEDKKRAIAVIFQCLEEKHILAYFNNSDLEKLAIEEGWSGKILDAEKDYLSVVSSNINGYKTDRMVEETITHNAEIQEDGSIIDTLRIKRVHTGGDAEYDWWNRVNSNYLRVYLPLGSELISAKGQSLEIYQAPIDYEKHNFKEDPLVREIEEKMIIDKKTGTRIFEESGKTVFGNWVYVSPGETVILEYKYKLPFKINSNKASDSYSLMAQKQLGSIGSYFNHELSYPEAWNVSWKYPEDSSLNSGSINVNTDLKKDRLLGATFEF